MDLSLVFHDVQCCSSLLNKSTFIGYHHHTPNNRFQGGRRRERRRSNFHHGVQLEWVELGEAIVLPRCLTWLGVALISVAPDTRPAGDGKQPSKGKTMEILAWAMGILPVENERIGFIKKKAIGVLGIPFFLPHFWARKRVKGV